MGPSRFYISDPTQRERRTDGLGLVLVEGQPPVGVVMVDPRRAPQVNTVDRGLDRDADRPTIIVPAAPAQSFSHGGKACVLEARPRPPEVVVDVSHRGAPAPSRRRACCS